MDWPRSVFLAMDWLWFALGLGSLCGAAALARRPSLRGRLDLSPRAAAALFGGLGALFALYKAAQCKALFLSTESAETSHVLWRLAHGGGFTNYISAGESMFRNHLQYAYLLLVPLARLWPSTAALAATQGAALALCAPAVFLCAKGPGGRAGLGLLSSLLLLSHPLFAQMAAYELEIRFFIPALFLWGACVWERGRRRTAMLLGVAILGCVDQAVLLFVGLALWAFLAARGRKERWAAAGCAVFFAALFLGEEALIRFWKAGRDLHSRWALFEPLGATSDSPGRLLRNAFLRPWIFPLALVLPPSKLWTPARMILGAGLLPLADGGAFAPALAAWLPQQLAAAGSGFQAMRGDYATVVFGPLLWAASRGLRRLDRALSPDQRHLLSAWVLAVCAVGFLTAGSFAPREPWTRPVAWRGAAERARGHIGRGARLWCDEVLLPAFAMRGFVKCLPNRPDPHFEEGLFVPENVLLTKVWLEIAEPGTRDRLLAFLRARGFVKVFDEAGIVVLSDPHTLRGEEAPLEWIRI